MKKIKMDEEGFVEIELGGVVVRIDLVEVHDKLIAFKENDKENFLANTVRLLSDLGLPGASQRTAWLFFKEIIAAVDELKKKDRESVASADSTASTLSG